MCPSLPSPSIHQSGGTFLDKGEILEGVAGEGFAYLSRIFPLSFHPDPPRNSDYDGGSPPPFSVLVFVVVGRPALPACLPGYTS